MERVHVPVQEGPDVALRQAAGMRTMTSSRERVVMTSSPAAGRCPSSTRGACLRRRPRVSRPRQERGTGVGAEGAEGAEGGRTEEVGEGATLALALWQRRAATTRAAARGHAAVGEEEVEITPVGHDGQVQQVICRERQAQAAVRRGDCPGRKPPKRDVQRPAAPIQNTAPGGPGQKPG
jgi:hypothetical protein